MSGWGIRGLRTASGILFLMIGTSFVIAAVGSAITGVLDGNITASIIIFVVFMTIGSVLLLIGWYVLREAIRNRMF